MASSNHSPQSSVGKPAEKRIADDDQAYTELEFEKFVGKEAKPCDPQSSVAKPAAEEGVDERKTAGMWRRKRQQAARQQERVVRITITSARLMASASTKQPTSGYSASINIVHGFGQDAWPKKAEHQQRLSPEDNRS